jgi:hypothetical protein
MWLFGVGPEPDKTDAVFLIAMYVFMGSVMLGAIWLFS